MKNKKGGNPITLPKIGQCITNTTTAVNCHVAASKQNAKNMIALHEGTAAGGGRHKRGGKTPPSCPTLAGTGIPAVAPTYAAGASDHMSPNGNTNIHAALTVQATQKAQALNDSTAGWADINNNPQSGGGSALGGFIESLNNMSGGTKRVSSSRKRSRRKRGTTKRRRFGGDVSATRKKIKDVAKRITVSRAAADEGTRRYIHSYHGDLNPYSHKGLQYEATSDTINDFPAPSVRKALEDPIMQRRGLMQRNAHAAAAIAAVIRPLNIGMARQGYPRDVRIPTRDHEGGKTKKRRKRYRVDTRRKRYRHPRYNRGRRRTKGRRRSRRCRRGSCPLSRHR